ncbi:MAG: glutamate-1-semialdehyde 2,1-aminomutase [Candidatus Obscuribacterales bacterium]|nr:glutamate-1-semialdehyde 2,1-aminomutase [Candidatus Obscuribacterales bacterium]
MSSKKSTVQEANQVAEPSTVSHNKSKDLFERAQKFIPGGVNSPARACRAVKSDPLFIERADGALIYDVDGNEYIDYVGSWGAMILGHRHPRVLEAIEDALQFGTSFGAPTAPELEIAELLCKLLPSVEMLRLVNSGTEACMSAARLARAYTSRPLILKFDGAYHGHADTFLVQAGSALATLGISASPGVPDEFARLTLSVPFNNLAALEKAFKEHKDKIAAVIVEPIVGNAGLILPTDGYHTGLRELCNEHGAVLIFDEVMTGFRVALGGAQSIYKIKPDLSCFGKVIGGGLPVGAYGGKKEIMERIAPAGDVYQAGTLSGNPLAVKAGLAQLKVLEQSSYARLEDRTRELAEGIQEIAKKAKESLQVAHVAGMITVFFTDKPVIDFESAKKSDTEKFAKFWQELIKRGVYWPPSQFEAAFVSFEHGSAEIEKTLLAIKEILS